MVLISHVTPRRLGGPGFRPVLVPFWWGGRPRPPAGGHRAVPYRATRGLRIFCGGPRHKRRNIIRTRFMGKRFWQIFFLSLLAGVLTGLAFASSYLGKFDFRNLLEHHLEVAFVAVAIGIILGILFSQMAYWCLKDKNLVIILPLLFISAVLATAWLTLAAHRIGNSFLGVWGACVFWILALLLAKFFAPKRRQKQL
jgi:hypothetical protein